LSGSRYNVDLYPINTVHTFSVTTLKTSRTGDTCVSGRSHRTLSTESKITDTQRESKAEVAALTSPRMLLRLQTWQTDSIFNYGNSHMHSTVHCLNSLHTTCRVHLHEMHMQ